MRPIRQQDHATPPVGPATAARPQRSPRCARQPEPHPLSRCPRGGVKIRSRAPPHADGGPARRWQRPAVPEDRRKRESEQVRSVGCSGRDPEWVCDLEWSHWIMRIQKQDDGWWIVEVPSIEATRVSYASCGPYATKAQALEDKRGLERFLREHGAHPAGEGSRPHDPAPQMAQADTASVGRAPPLPEEPRPGWRRKRVKSAPGQKLLPGFELDDGS
jgi:hypothetical protein